MVESSERYLLIAFISSTALVFIALDLIWNLSL